MDISSQLQDRIDQYLRKELQGEELDTFQEEMLGNKELAEAVRQQELMVSQLSFLKHKDYFKSIHQELVEEGKITPGQFEPKTVRLSPWVWVGRIAASILLLGMIVWLLIPSKPAFVAALDEEFKPGGRDMRMLVALTSDTDLPPEISEKLNQTRRAEDNSIVKRYFVDSLKIAPELINTIYKIEREYNQLNNAPNLESFVQLADTIGIVRSTQEIEQYPLAFQHEWTYLQAMSYARGKQYPQAIEQFQSLYDHNQSSPTSEAYSPQLVEFYLGLMYFYEDGKNSTRGRALFETIQQQEDHDYGEQVARITKSL